MVSCKQDENYQRIELICPQRIFNLFSVMSTIHELVLLKTLIKLYFSKELQHDETPLAAKKRVEILKEILTLCEQ